MMASGTSHAPTSACCSAAFLAACSSGVALGRRYAAASGSNARASSSTSASSRARSAAKRSSEARTSSSTAAYVFFPTVRLPTMEASADASAPTHALAPPPPGVGAALASWSMKSFMQPPRRTSGKVSERAPGAPSCPASRPSVLLAREGKRRRGRKGCTAPSQRRAVPPFGKNVPRTAPRSCPSRPRRCVRRREPSAGRAWS